MHHLPMNQRLSKLPKSHQKSRNADRINSLSIGVVVIIIKEKTVLLINEKSNKQPNQSVPCFFFNLINWWAIMPKILITILMFVNYLIKKSQALGDAIQR